MSIAAEDGEHSPILPIWQELVIGSIAFALLGFVLLKFVLPRMEAMYQARVEAIEGGIKRAEAAQAEANKLLEQYKAQLAEARTEAARIRDDARAEAESIRQDILAKAREESDRIIAAGKEQLAGERQTLVRELRAEIGTLAVDLASRIVGESLADEARRRGTVERFLANSRARGPLMQAASRESYARAAERLDGVHRAAPSRGDRRTATSPRGRRPAAPRAAAAPGTVGPGPLRRGAGRAAAADPRRQDRRGRPDLLAALVAGRWRGRRSCSTRPSGSGWRRCWPAPSAAGELGEVEDELFRFGQIVDGTRALRGALGDPTVGRHGGPSWSARCSRARPSRSRYGCRSGAAGLRRPSFAAR